MRTEITFLALLLFGTILRFQHISGAGVLLTATAITFSFSYLVFGFYLFCDREVKRQNLALSIISGLALSTAPLAYLFQIQHWQGAGVMVLPVVLSSGILLLITIPLRLGDSEPLHRYYNRHLLRLSFWLGLALILWFLPSGAFPPPPARPGHTLPQYSYHYQVIAAWPAT